MTRPPYQGGGLARLVTGDFGFFDFGAISPQSLWRRVASLSGGEWRVASGPGPGASGLGEWRLVASGEWRVARVSGDLIQFRRLSLCGAEWRV